MGQSAAACSLTGSLCLLTFSQVLRAAAHCWCTATEEIWVWYKGSDSFRPSGWKIVLFGWCFLYAAQIDWSDPLYQFTSVRGDLWRSCLSVSASGKVTLQYSSLTKFCLLCLHRLIFLHLSLLKSTNSTLSYIHLIECIHDYTVMFSFSQSCTF